MAFGKKKKDDAAAPNADESAPIDAPEEGLGDAMFSGSDGGADDAITAGLAAEEKAASADPLSTDLLNMFQTTQIEAEDLSAILDLAGDVEIDDLLEELHTVALALGVRLEEIEEDEALAA